MSKQLVELSSLNPQQVAVLDTWHNIDGHNLHRLLSIINKTFYICREDERYHLSDADAATLLTFSDVAAELISSK